MRTPIETKGTAGEGKVGGGGVEAEGGVVVPQVTLSRRNNN